MIDVDEGSSIEAWTLALARPTIAPAGGSAAAIAGAMAASLVAMATGLTTERQRYAAVHADAVRLRSTADELRTELLALASEDARVFASFSDALALPVTTERERSVREAAKHDALREGARVQLDVLRRTAAIVSLCEQVVNIAPPSTIGDTATAAFLAAAAARSAYWAAKSDLGESNDETSELLRQAEAAESQISTLLRARLS